MLKICVFSGKRGGFGAYVPLMQLIEEGSNLELQILLGDMHASKEFGRTIKEATELFPKSRIELIEMDTGRGDTPLIRTENLGICLQKAVKILERLESNIVLVHADRGEHLMVAFAALNLGMVVAHTQGGDVSGNIDDIQRHAVTKLAHIHFPENKNAAERIQRMGEENWRIHVVGSTYIDRIAKKMYTPRDIVRKKYGLGENEEFFIIILHPDTFESQQKNYENAKTTFKAVESFGLRSFVVYPCSDPGYEGVLNAIAEIEGSDCFLVYKNIDNLDFLGLMKEARALIGNSSCAIVEAPYFQLPAINIGNRQMGRECEENVVDALPNFASIKEKIEFVLTDASFKKKLQKCGYHLGNGHTAEKIVKVLKSTPINKKLLQKRLTY